MSRTFHLRQYSRRRLVYVGLFVFVIYWTFFRPRKYTATFELVLQEPNSIEPKRLWEFIADFSNHPKLNPTITNFEILYEKGNYENWEYGVNFEQDSLLFPFHYTNHAVFKILPEIKESFKHIQQQAKLAKSKTSSSLFNIHEPARILTNFTTCSMGFCFPSESEITIMSTSTTDSAKVKSSSTKIFETFHFVCSPIFYYFYSADIHRQKKLVYTNIENSIDMM